ncbi:MAG: hypothetical protein ACM3PP_03935 [Candidatus Saccharibacteria bacterium]
MRSPIELLKASRLVPHQGYCIKDYKKNGGIFASGVQVAIEFKRNFKSVSLYRVSWEPKQHFLREVNCSIDKRTSKTLLLSTSGLDPGMYLLMVDNGAIKFYINPPQKQEIGVIVPTLTEWAYHHDGFYWSNHRRLTHYMMMAAKKFGLLTELTSSLEKRYPSLFVYPYHFPAHREIKLTGYYIQNPRWRDSVRDFFDPFLNDIDLLWSEEYKCGIPLAAMLDKLSAPVAFFSDFDLVLHSSDLYDLNKIILYGAEMMTATGFEFLSQVQEKGKPHVLFWGMQGIGAKEVHYDADSGVMYWKGAKGECGLSGEVVDNAPVSWGEGDGAIFGFSFPTPLSPGWRTMHSRLVVDHANDHLVKGINAQQLKFSNPNCQPADNPGLTNAGGEFFDKHNPESQVIAHLDDIEQRIGIGRFGVFTHVSPTYLPAFGAYFSDLRPEVLTILKNWLNEDTTGGAV